MEKNTSLIIIGLLLLIVGFGSGYVARGSEAPAAGTHMMSGGMMMQDSGMGMMDMDEMMDGMMQELAGKQGDAFDQAFIDEMIVHHEGAVRMAQAALVAAKHTEIKQMAEDIISAQTREINMMKAWRSSWYGN